MLNYTYLASKEEITIINENDVAQYDYIAVFHFGSGDPQVMEKEKNLMRSTLARFMRSKCLIVSYDELLKVDSSHFLKSHYHDFITPSDLEHYVAICTIFTGINDELFFSPYYQPIVPKSGHRYTYLAGLNMALESLKDKLTFLSLSSFPLPKLPSRSQNACIPNSDRIKELRAPLGSLETVVAKIKRLAQTKEIKTIGETTLGNTEHFFPCDLDTIQTLAALFNVSPESLKLEQVVPNKHFLRQLRSETQLDTKNLALQFGIVSPYFFELVEQSNSCPEYALRYLFYKYNELFSKSCDLIPQVKQLKMKDFIDQDTTLALVQKPY